MVIPCVGDGLGICQAVPMVSCVACGAQWLCCVEVRAPAGRGLARLPVPREIQECGARACAQLANARGHQENMSARRHSARTAIHQITISHSFSHSLPRRALRHLGCNFSTNHSATVPHYLLELPRWGRAWAPLNLLRRPAISPYQSPKHAQGSIDCCLFFL